jgi:hypothetical protein
MTVPWEQLPGESAKAYAAFCLYRDLGPRRSLDEASRSYHGHGSGADGDRPARRRRASGTIRRWADRWNWPARACAWDQERMRVQASEELEAVKEMAKRHLQEARVLQNKAIQRLSQLQPEELKPRETLDYLIEGTKLERLVLGEPTERVAEEHHFGEVQEMSDDELAQIIARARERLLSSGNATAGGSGPANRSRAEAAQQ